ncbi:protein phosphatase 1 regulatory subunit 12B-like isoform X2 [Hippocampus zosterae]|uniref:protein phosphatase 1 regulatory subunit 12B-like isoform X2 n=1 Tax=Hippocampus zosterae TaxID=109293 RepID=UPI00223D9DCA|nr:protein phosphatase 1 regulatory subunit 12B-like isoform X2 [Hippocampus zosterae]
MHRLQEPIAMSSQLSHSRDHPRIRKSPSDSSSSSSSSPANESLRSFLFFRLNSSGLSDTSNNTKKNHAESYFTRRENRLSARKKYEEEIACNDYKKMYEKALATNQRLKSRLETSKQELVVIQEQLQRAQHKERKSELGSNMLETEKKDSQSLRKKISDMEEQVKVKAELHTENQRLKDENGALIRVITKLSK